MLAVADCVITASPEPVRVAYTPLRCTAQVFRAGTMEVLLTRYALAATAALIGSLVASPASAGGNAFDVVTDALDPQACDGQGCWTNHMRLADTDGDGDLDIILANYPDFFFGSATGEPLVIYENDGAAAFTNVSGTALGNYWGPHHQIAMGDVDGDGSLDIFSPAGSGDAYVLFINDGAGVFTNETAERMPGGPFPEGGATRMGDVDNDGDLDIFSADGYATDGPPFGHLYLNDGLGMFTEAAGAVPETISGSNIDDVEFLDVDRDFDLDLFVNAHSGGTGALWLNDGDGTFAAGPTVAPPGNDGFHYNAAPCDVDGDGDLDMWIDNIGGGYSEQLLINDGDGNLADETNARVTGNGGDDDNGVVCVDVDADGDFDAVVIALASPERLLENDGDGNFTFVTGVFPGSGNCSLWGEFGDLDGDGRIDFVTSQGECSSSDEVYLANDGVPVDTQAPTIIAVEEPGGVQAGDEVAVRFAVSDRVITDDGPQLARTFAVVEPEGAATSVDAVAMGGDLFRVVLPASEAGTVTFQVCAEDRNANVGCSENQTYDVGASAEESGDATEGPSEDTAADAGPDSGMVDSGMVDSGDGPGPSTNASSNDATGGGTADTTDSAGNSGDGGGGGGGCGCQQSDRDAWSWLALGLLGLPLIRRRRHHV